MEPMILNLIILITALLSLVKGSDYFVEYASTIAKLLGVSEFVIGLTLVSIGTSIPELASSMAAVFQQAEDVVIGNIIGSNIANIALVVGFAVLFANIKTDRKILKKDGYIMLFAVILFFIFSLDYNISRFEAIIFLFLYLSYIFYSWDPYRSNDSDKKSYIEEFLRYSIKFKYLKTIKKRMKPTTSTDINGRNNKKLLKSFVILSISGIAVILGARYFIQQAVYFANIFNVSDTIIGISLVALGTSLPELMVTAASAKKGYGYLILGNVIGSNITNTFLILGLSGLVVPLGIVGTDLFLIMTFMIFLSAILLLFVWTQWELKQPEGVFLLLVYILFITTLLTQYSPSEVIYT
ncbi:calcium/sodium antiporter [Methanohalobium sp.]|uniref:calcium/sodium antiporter n=1 Tax=Methanohalobium sp. TaxID=2837493 RepID=UPI0025CBAE00|nr:calcium/sodium antiporter [Methanohalobium sp.]